VDCFKPHIDIEIVTNNITWTLPKCSIS